MATSARDVTAASARNVTVTSARDVTAASARDVTTAKFWLRSSRSQSSAVSWLDSSQITARIWWYRGRILVKLWSKSIPITAANIVAPIGSDFGRDPARFQFWLDLGRTLAIGQ